MKNPTEKQFDKVIANLEKAFEIAKHNAPVNMMTRLIDKDISKNHICETPMCHGGWYAVATIKNLNHLDYKDGSNKMAKHLGFEDNYALREWATLNPELWGNNLGAYMFCDGAAFNQPLDFDFGLQVIINHWKAVKERVLAIKKKS